VARHARLPGEHLLSQARERALTLLYEADVKGISPRDVLANQIVTPDPLTTLLVEGVADDLELLNGLISANARGWTIERMPTLDRAVLRMAITELRRRADVPVAVVIDEAVSLAKRFSTDDSGKFVNGMLSTIARDMRKAQPVSDGGDSAE
jgi:transcription antitermination protein NusB